MKTIKRPKLYGISLFLAAFALSGCFREAESGLKNGRGNDISIVINVPGPAASRAIVEGSSEDNAVTVIDVLMFDIGNAGMYAGRVSPNFISNTSPTTREFTVSMPEGNYELAILANARGIIDDATLTVGSTTKAQAYGLLTGSLPPRTAGVPLSGVWNAQPGSDGYRDFPMWGEVVVNTATTTSVGNVDMVRMLAKINLTFASQTVSNKLEIEEIYLCNYNSEGYLAGSPDWQTAPNPHASKQAGFGNRLIYANTPGFGNIIDTYAGIQYCNDQIFLFEVAKPTDQNVAAQRTASTCLIVKGYYDGGTDPSFYRIDLKNAGGDYLNVLRNHNYQITVQDVRGSGANTGEIAYDSESADITATVREWSAGYESWIDYGGQYHMIVNRSEFSFIWEGAPVQILEVFSDHPGGWMAEDLPSWIHLGRDSSDNTTDFEYVLIYCDQNTGASQRTGEFYITTGLLRKQITVTQAFNVEGFPTDPSPLADTYVGAFWRASETGERIIRIPNVIAANAGAWTASVTKMDDRWNEDDIVLDATPLSPADLSDRGISWVFTQTPVTAENFPLTGNATSVSATVAAGGEIFFRIGLKGVYISTPQYPARYAVVTLSYGNPVRTQKIFLRQGEAADYLMRPGDSGTDVGGRTLAVKYSPYNLTASEYNGYGSMDQWVDVGAGGGVPADYPSQAGAFFQWTGAAGVRAYHPTIFYINEESDWNPGNMGSVYWGNPDPNNPGNTVAQSYESCPSGYRRPTDGNAYNTAAITMANVNAGNSEMGQSLFLNPPTGLANSIDNVVWGYYADGFFDRRAIVTQISNSGMPNTAVATDSSTVAYIGQLFYNPDNNASLFFPASGERDTGDGALHNTGLGGFYWSSSSGNYFNSNALDVRSDRAFRSSYSRMHGFSIRCVADTAP